MAGVIFSKNTLEFRRRPHKPPKAPNRVGVGTAISPSQNDFGSLLLLLSRFGSRASSYRRAGKNGSNDHLVLTYLSIRCAWAFGPTQREFGRFGPNEFPKIRILSWEINRNVL